MDYNIIRIGLDSPYNIIDNVYTSAKKTVQEAVISSTDDIDNVVDIVDIDFKKDNNQNNKNSQNYKDNIFEKFIDFFSGEKANKQ